MSVILPYQYKAIADKLGAIYGKIRDSMFNESDSDTAYNVAQLILSETSNAPHYTTGGLHAESDVTTWGCAPAGTGESEVSSNANYSVWIGNSAKYTAPPNSIGTDLSIFMYSFANTTFNEESAKTVATNLVGNALRKLNAHIVKRMSSSTSANRTGLDGTTFTVNNISDYYTNYAYVSDADAVAVGMSASQLSIFDYGTEAGLDASPTYFSQNFAELSARIGTTINDQFITP